MSRYTALGLLACGLLGTFCAASAGTRAHDLVIRDVRIVDVAAERVSAPTSVSVDGGKIAAIGDAPARARRSIDGRGRFLMPGLWDMHVHALWTPGVWPLASAQFLASCVTGVRDMGGTLDELERARAFAGPAPRLAAAGLVLDGPAPVDPSISIGINDAASAREAVSRLRSRADFLKVYTLLPAKAFPPLMASARAAGIHVAGHVPHGVSAADASRLGMRSIEHMQAETGLYCDPATPAACRALFDTFKRHSTWQTPTLIARATRAHRSPADVGAALDSVRAFPAAVRRLWAQEVSNRRSATGESIRRKQADFDRERALARLLIGHDVPLLAGSDAGLPLVPYGRSLHQEFAWLIEAGATPGQALRAATTGPARYFGFDAGGRIEAGAPADFCLLDGNPLADAGLAGRPSLTVVGGRIGFGPR